MRIDVERGCTSLPPSQRLPLGCTSHLKLPPRAHTHTFALSSARTASRSAESFSTCRGGGKDEARARFRRQWFQAKSKAQKCDFSSVQLGP